MIHYIIMLENDPFRTGTSTAVASLWYFMKIVGIVSDLFLLCFSFFLPRSILGNALW